MKAVQKEYKDKRFPLNLELKPFRSQMKGNYFAGRGFQSLAV